MGTWSSDIRLLFLLKSMIKKEKLKQKFNLKKIKFFVLNIKIKSSKQSPVDPTVFDVLFKDEKKEKKKRIKMFKRSETTNGHKYKVHEDYEYK